MVRCTKYWDKIIGYVEAGDMQAIATFCQKDRFQTELIVEHAGFMNAHADEYGLVVVGIPDPEAPEQISPSAESAFRNLRKAWRAEDTDTVAEVLTILKAQLTMIEEAERKPVTAREVNKVLAKVAPQYLAKTDPKKRRLTVVVSPAEYKVFATYAMTIHPKETETKAVMSLAYSIMREYIAKLKARKSTAEIPAKPAPPPAKPASKAKAT